MAKQPCLNAPQPHFNRFICYKMATAQIFKKHNVKYPLGKRNNYFNLIRSATFTYLKTPGKIYTSNLESHY